MGRYINFIDRDNGDKSAALLECGAVELSSPPDFDGIPEGKALVCVGDNTMFQYAAHVHNEREHQEFTSPAHTESQRWFLIDSEKCDSLVRGCPVDSVV